MVFMNRHVKVDMLSNLNSLQPSCYSEMMQEYILNTGCELIVVKATASVPQCPLQLSPSGGRWAAAEGWDDTCVTAVGTMEDACAAEIKAYYQAYALPNPSGWNAAIWQTDANAAILRYSRVFREKDVAGSTFKFTPPCCQALCQFVAKTCACVTSFIDMRSAALSLIYGRMTFDAATPCAYRNVGTWGAPSSTGGTSWSGCQLVVYHAKLQLKISECEALAVLTAIEAAEHPPPRPLCWSFRQGMLQVQASDKGRSPCHMEHHVVASTQHPHNAQGAHVQWRARSRHATAWHFGSRQGTGA
ncbi:hypothetical protein HaLaN_14693 [Haematococcus lacustris]|uniref:Uncharacterized protein n=1 Tax=Haematococcus lacustris TaxID=44745 RepID=A0A699Z8Q4_HAELA|nr:hypothetical protein HaLaN_14693 [Haematococcus lacustris]